MRSNYDYQQDRSQSQAPQPPLTILATQQQQEIDIAKVPSQLRKLTQQVRTQDSLIRKLQKQMEIRVTQTTLTQTIALINSGIHSDANLIKLLKIKSDIQDQDKDGIQINACALSRKLNQFSDALTLLLSLNRKVQAKVVALQNSTAGQLAEKSSQLQLQIDEVRADVGKQSMQLQQKMEMFSSQLGDKLRDIQTKVSWRLNQFKNKIDDKINQQLVLMYLQNSQKKMDKSMREYQLSINIDPACIDKMQNDIQKNRITAENMSTQLKHQLTVVDKCIKNQLLKIIQYRQENHSIEKRLEQFYINFTEVYQRVKTCEGKQITMESHISKLLKDDDFSLAQLKRINTVLLNLKIGQDFQRMLQQMDPTKVLQLQDKVQQVQQQQGNLFHQIALAKRQIDTINAKADIMGIIVPNKTKQKLKKQQISSAMNDFLIENAFAAKISALDKQLTSYKNTMDSVAVLSRQVARLTKESEWHQLAGEIRGLEEYVRREVGLVREEAKSLARGAGGVGGGLERTVSNGLSAGSADYVPISQVFPGRSFSVKKMGGTALSSSRYKITDIKLSKK